MTQDRIWLPASETVMASSRRVTFVQIDFVNNLESDIEINVGDFTADTAESKGRNLKDVAQSPRRRSQNRCAFFKWLNTAYRSIV